MKIRLLYSGEVRATRRQPKPNERNDRAAHKHRIRKVFHRQLRRVWETDPFLSTHRSYPKDYQREYQPPDRDARWALGEDKKVPLAGLVATNNKRLNYSFVPMTWSNFHLTCELDILLLRPETSRGPLQSSDIDNQVKTVLDALRMPLHPNEFVEPYTVPDEDERPFYCLLQDDNQVRKISVEVDQFLGDIPQDADDPSAFAHVLVRAHVYPYAVNMLNLAFGN